MKLKALLVVGLLLCSGQVWSQDRKPDAPARCDAQRKQPPRKWWLDERYRQALGLSAQQVASIDRIYDEHAVVQRELWTSFQQAEKEASALIAVEAPNEAKVTAAIERAELLRYKLNERRALCLFRIRQQLTLAQHLKFSKLHEADR